MLMLFIGVAISAVVLVGAFYARFANRPDGLIGLYVTFTLASQVIATKISEFDFGFITVNAPAAVMIFAVTFLITDLVNERFGRRETQRMIVIALISQAAFALFIVIGGLLPAAPFWQDQSSWDKILGFVPRIMVASWITFLVSENLDAYLFSKLREMTDGRFIWLRNAGSSLISLTIDTVIFINLAFAGTGLPLVDLMQGQFVAKYVVAIICIPFMYLGRAIMTDSRDLKE